MISTSKSRCLATRLPAAPASAALTPSTTDPQNIPRHPSSNSGPSTRTIAGTTSSPRTPSNWRLPLNPLSFLMEYHKKIKNETEGSSINIVEDLKSMDKKNNRIIRIILKRFS